MRDLVIGAITNYKWEDIEPFVVSLEQSGFDGYKCMLMYQGSQELIDKLEGRGWIIFAHEKDPNGGVTYRNKDTFNICVERFYHYWAFLSQVEERDKIRAIIACDVKDVVFQKNPSDVLEEIVIVPVDIIASGEGLRYRNEPWGWNNMNLSFGPEISEMMSGQIIKNAGVIAGFREPMLELFLHTFLLCRGAPYHVPGGGGPDQAAYNLAVRRFKYMLTGDDEAWACQAGTIADPSKIESFRPVLHDEEPIWDKSSGLVLNSFGEPYAIVHQYDRVPEWKSVILEKYRDNKVH